MSCCLRYMFIQLCFILAFALVANLGAEEFLIKIEGKYLGWDKGKKQFQPCTGKVIDVGKGKIEKASEKCPHDPNRIRIVVGFLPDSRPDLYARGIARSMGRYISDKASVVVENMPGAGSAIAANYLYEIAKPDGLTLGSFSGNVILSQVEGSKLIQFDARKFEWVGSPARDNIVCVVTKASKITSVEKWLTTETPVKFGGIGPGEASFDIPKVLKEALRLPIQPVPGYTNTAEIRLAAQSGQISGGCSSWDAVKATWGKSIASGDAVVLLQVTPKKLRDLASVPLAIDFAKTNTARLLIQAGVYYPSAIRRSYVLPPSTPKERVEVIRKALTNTLKNEEFLADMRELNLDVDPVPGEEVQKIVDELFKPDVARALKEILK